MKKKKVIKIWGAIMEVGQQQAAPLQMNQMAGVRLTSTSWVS